MRQKALAAIFCVALSSIAASAQDADPVIARIRVLFRDPQEQQPKWECPKSTEPGQETICLRYPNSFTVDVRQVFSGDRLPRRTHAILAVHTFPSSQHDLFVVGTLSPSGVISVSEWNDFAYAGCPPDEAEPKDSVAEKIDALRLAGLLPCKKQP
jgi:hypothetical protein